MVRISVCESDDAGSIPTDNPCWYGSLARPVVKTLPFHGKNKGSIPLQGTKRRVV